MGRLDHVKQSTQALLADPRIDGVNNFFIFVDYYCPQNSGDWVEAQYGERAHVVHFSKEAPLTTSDRPIFNKPVCQNSGAVTAIAEGAQYLVFIDADTLAGPSLLDFIFHSASLDRFMIFEPSLKWRDLTGFLVVHTRHFMKVNGFNKDFKGWGAEDLEIRLNLYLRGRAPLHDPRAILRDPEKYSLRWTEMPAALASSIPHDDDRRVAHYEEQDKDKSHSLNLNLLCSNVFNWIGIHPADLHDSRLGPYVRRLLGMDLLLNPRAME